MNEFYELNRDVFTLLVHKIQPKLYELGLYPGQELFINMISNNEGITAIDLAKLTNRKRSTITKSLQCLEKNGYIIKKSSDDKRKYPIYLTEKGKDLNNKLKKIFQNSFNDFENIISIEEKNTIINILKRIKEELND